MIEVDEDVVLREILIFLYGLAADVVGDDAQTIFFVGAESTANVDALLECAAAVIGQAEIGIVLCLRSL